MAEQQRTTFRRILLGLCVYAVGTSIFIYTMNAVHRSRIIKIPSSAMEESYQNRSDESSDVGFLDYLRKFPLEDYDHAFQVQDVYKIAVYNQKFLSHLMTYVLMEPKVPINESCQTPPPLIPPHQLNCSAYPKGLTGIRRKIPAKIAHIVNLGFDVDALEAHLRQVYDLVDFFFILEATRAHGGIHIRKVLVWDSVRHQQRFKPFQDKVVYFALNDSDSTPNQHNLAKNEMWVLENHQEKRRWEMFLEWNQKHGYFSDSDLVGFGHADELPSRLNLQLLKHCDIEGSIDIGIWFPMGLIHQAFATDFPVPHHPFTYGDPTFWPIYLAKAHRPYPPKMQGRSNRYLLGGCHMSDIRYAPFIITKIHTCTECGPNHELVKQILSFVKKGDEAIFEMEQFFGVVRTKDIRNRIHNITDVQEELKDIVDVPWFLDCNRDRYPYWEGRHDTRL